MAVKLITAILAKDEAGPDRHFTRVLQRALEFSDAVVVLDDGSTDRTAEYAVNLGARVRRRDPESPPAWGAESSARRELWEYALEFCPDADSWLLICDADMEMVGNVRELCQTKELNTWSFILYDLWNEKEFRSDGFWRGHLTARPWLFAPRRVPPQWVPTWGQRGVHVGHCPHSWWQVELTGIAPPDQYHWRHWSYATPESRRKKYEQYQAVSHQLSPEERAHAESIICPA